MTIETIAAIGVSTGAIGTTQLAATASSAQAPGAFDATVQYLEGLNAKMAVNQESVQTLATGDAQNLHRVLMELERTKLEFELALQVRNKVLEAYQELMRMQV